MRHIKEILTIMVMLITLTAYAESDGTTITVSSSVALPVRVKPNGGSAFTISSRSYTTSRRIADATFYDAKGNRCMVSHSTAHTGGNVHHYYSITGVYSSSSSSYDSASSSSYDSDSSSDSSTTISDTWVTGSQIPVEGYPCVALGAGMSRFAGEFARIKWSIGGLTSLVLQASVGKDLFFDLPNKDEVAWNAGMGIRIGKDNHDFNINILFGETPLCENYGLLMNAEYEYYFGEAKRFGVFGGIGVVLGDTEKKDPDCYFDFHLGVAVKLWQK